MRISKSIVHSPARTLIIGFAGLIFMGTILGGTEMLFHPMGENGLCAYHV